MADGTPDPGTPDGTDAEPKKRINWKRLGKVGVPILALVIAVIAILGLIYPDEAKDPTARAGVASHEQAIANLGTDLTDVKTQLGNKATTDDLAALQQKTESRDDALTTAIGLLPTKDNVTAEIGTAVSAEATARTAADTDITTRLGAVETTLADPANPGTSITDRLGVIEALVAPPPQPTGPIGHFTLHPVR